MGRTHINSCDFSLENYAHCDTPGDLNLSTFSIERDKKMIIPFIKDALELSLEPIKNSGITLESSIMDENK